MFSMQMNVSASGKRMLFAGTLLTMTALDGGTVAWYRFDEKDPGATIGQTETLSISDAAGGCSPGTAYAYVNVAAVTDGTAEAYKPAYAAMPVEAGTRAGIVLTDPLSGNSYSNRSSLAFTCAANGSTRNYYGGSVKVDRSSNDALSRWACGSITVEAFVKAPKEWANYSGSGFIFESTTTGSAQKDINIGLAISNAGQLDVVFKTVNTPSSSEGGMGYEAFTVGESGFFNDNKWHHVAVTYDETTATAKLWVDYVEKGSGTSAYGTGKLAASNGRPFYIGGPENATRRFKGWIDEVRVSDAVLAPTSFLRMECVTPCLVAHAAAEGVAGTEIADQTDIADSRFSTTLASVRGASSTNTMTLCKSGDSTSGRYSSVVPGAQVRNGFRATKMTANGSSLELVRTSAASGASVKLATMKDLYADSFTSEMFYKIASPTPTDWAGAVLFGQSQTGGAKMSYSLYLDSRNYLSYTTSDSATNVWLSYGQDLNDGKWHHAALVYDKDAQTVKVYGDYQLKIWLTDVTLHKSTHDLDPYFGSQNGTASLFNGQFDEMRIVRQPLKPMEFLTVSEAASATYAKTRGFWDFEGSKTGQPYATLVGDADFGANGAARPGFVAKVPSPTYCYDGAAGADERANTCSVSLNGGFIGFDTSSVVEDGTFTAEFFSKFMSVSSDGASIFRIIPNTSSGASYRSSEPILDVTIKGRDKVSVAALMTTNGVSGVASEDVALPQPIVAASGWQHLAFSCRQLASTWELTVFVNHQAATKVTFEGTLAMPIKSSMSIGSSADPAKALHGYVDLFRVSDLITDPDEFIGPLSTPCGFMLIYR